MEGWIPTYPAAAAVILATDIFGYERPQFREIVDKVGRAGFLAVAPDFFRGSAFVHGYNYTAWVSAHPPENSLDHAKAVVEALNITNIGGVGFCWGGKLVVELLTGPLIHPSSTNVEGIKAPVSILVGDLDTYTNVSLATQFEVALKAKPEVFSFNFLNLSLQFDDDDYAGIIFDNDDSVGGELGENIPGAKTRVGVAVRHWRCNRRQERRGGSQRCVFGSTTCTTNFLVSCFFFFFFYIRFRFINI